VKPPRERVIVGLGVFVHDTSVAIMRDGQVLFAAEQERFDRHKHSQNIPVDALNAGLRWCGLQFSDIDEIVVNYDGWAIWPPYFRHIWRFLPKTLRMAFDYRRLNNARKMGGYKNNLRLRFGAIDHIAF